MHVIDGKALAARMRASLKDELSTWSRTPCVAILLIGEDPASKLYVDLKEKASAEIGVRTRVIRLPADTADHELMAIIKKWNEDPEVNGILVQMPLPPGHDSDRIIETMDPTKDADGFHPTNRAALLRGASTMIPPVHEGILRLLAHTPLRIHGATVALIMQSAIFADPLSRLLTAAGATVHVMHPDEMDWHALTLADAIVIAIGRPRFLTRSMTKPNAVIIDVGTTSGSDGKVMGDVDQASYRETEVWITPVPGGVGPMTIAMLLKNVITLAGQRSV